MSNENLTTNDTFYPIKIFLIAIFLCEILTQNGHIYIFITAYQAIYLIEISLVAEL